MKKASQNSGSRGRFITFEGGEGSGKSTQIKLLAEALQKKGIRTLLTREPGGSPTAEKIRSLLLDPETKLDPMTQLFLFNAARRDHVCAVIEPALSKDTWVLCDRFADSSRAYQGAAGHVPARTILRYERDAVGKTRPDLTIILDVEPATGLERAQKRLSAGTRADAFEAADLVFHEKVRSAFLEIARTEPQRCKVLNGDQNKEHLQNEVLAACTERFPELLKVMTND